MSCRRLSYWLPHGTQRWTSWLITTPLIVRSCVVPFGWIDWMYVWPHNNFPFGHSVSVKHTKNRLLKWYLKFIMSYMQPQCFSVHLKCLFWSIVRLTCQTEIVNQNRQLYFQLAYQCRPFIQNGVISVIALYPKWHHIQKHRHNNAIRVCYGKALSDMNLQQL